MGDLLAGTYVVRKKYLNRAAAASSLQPSAGTGG
jgi:hypothetical protein